MRQAVRIHGRRVSYLESGTPDGRVLVLLHAFPLAAAMWRPQLDRAPAGWRVIAPDLAGFGETEDEAARPPALDDYAQDVVALLDELSIQSAVVGGLSLGGYVTLALARRSPDRLSAIVLADTRAAADTAEGREGRDRMLAALEDEGVEAVVRSMLPKLLGAATRATRPALVEQVGRWIRSATSCAIARAIVRLRARPDATPVLAGIRVPALVLVGENDEATPPADAERLRDGIAGARYESIPASGHLSNLENPDAFTAALHRFLASL